MIYADSLFHFFQRLSYNQHRTSAGVTKSDLMWSGSDRRVINLATRKVKNTLGNRAVRYFKDKCPDLSVRLRDWDVSNNIYRRNDLKRAMVVGAIMLVFS